MALFVSALIIGVFLGTIYGLMAFGMVASYRISRVVNLGQAGVAALGATVYYWMTAQWGAPVIVSLFAAIAVAALVGGFMGWCNLLMADWPKGFVMIFTLCVTLLLFAYVDHILPPTTIAPVSPFGSSGFNFALTFVAAHQIGTFAVTLATVAAAMSSLLAKIADGGVAMVRSCSATSRLRSRLNCTVISELPPELVDVI